MSDNPLLREPAAPSSPPDASEESGFRMNFSGEVAREFEQKVISNQIPGYESMRERCLQFSAQFLRDGTNFVDLGCSTGKTIRDLVQYLHATDDSRAETCWFTGLDIEDDMLRVAQTLFEETMQGTDRAVDRKVVEHTVRGMNTSPGASVSFVERDLREGFRPVVPNLPTSVVVSIFTMQFLPLEFRPRILTDIYDSLAPGGAFLLAEKVLVPERRIDDALSLAYYDVKARDGGMTDAEILKKRSRLENYLLPLTTNANKELLVGAGFDARSVSPVWRDLQFEMYLAVK